MRSIGIDVDRDFCEVAIAEGGSVRTAGRVATEPQALALLARWLGPDDEVAIQGDGQRGGDRADHRAACAAGGAGQPEGGARAGAARKRRTASMRRCWRGFWP